MQKFFVLGWMFFLVGCSSGSGGAGGSSLSTMGSAAQRAAPLAPGELPLELFFRNPVAKNVMISPDGTMLLALQPFKGRMNVFIRPVAGATEWKALTTISDRDIAGAWWKGNTTVLFLKDFGGDENFHLFSVDVKSQQLQDLTNHPETRVTMIDDLHDVSDTDVIVGMNKRDPKINDVYRINVQTGKADLVLQNPGNFTSYMTDHSGTLRIAMATDGVNNTLYHRKSDADEFKKIATFNFKQALTPITFDKNNVYVYGVSDLNGNTKSAVEINPQTGKIVKTLFTQKKYDVSGLNYSDARKELIAAYYVDFKTQPHFFSSYYKTIFEDVKRQLPGKEVQMPSANKAEDRFVVAASNDRSGAKYYTYDATTKKLEFLMDSTPWLKEEDLVEMKPIQYTSRDGRTIHGYLFLPKKGGGKNLPVVVNPHGGPWARDVWGFHPEAQFLANRGYAVFKMNFRGSVGYGKKFWQASFKQWGLTMQNDVTDGVQWLIKQGIADPKRVAIYGGSYGGYATLAGLAFTPDLYRCGVDYVGVSNLFTLMETVPPYWKPMQDMFYEMIGHPVKEKDLVRKASPLFSADKIKKPLFVAQGAKDPRVKKSESDQIVEALKKRGVDVPYLVKENEGHGFRNEENRFDFYIQMEAFLDKHMTVM